MASLNLCQVTFPQHDDDYREAMQNYCRELLGSDVYRERDGAIGKIKEIVREKKGEVFVRVAYSE